MLKNLTWLSKKLYILGIDWQFDTMHMMLLGCANKTNKSNRFNNLDHHKWLGQWRLSLPLLSASGALKVPAVWQKFTLELERRLNRKFLVSNSHTKALHTAIISSNPELLG